MICFTEVNEFIVKQWRCVLFPFWAFIFAGQSGLHSVGDCFPINETKGPKSGFTDVVKQ